MKWLCSLAATIVIFLGCTTPGAPAVETTAAATPTDVPTSSPEISASVVPTPGPEAWGPLAVIPPQDGADTARTEGTLRITDTCVFLVERGGPVLLLWPADRTTWDAEQRTITFANFDGTTATVGDGQPVVLGGGGGSSAESGVTTGAWVAGMTWVARPADGCPLDPYWGVGDVRG